MVEEAANWLSTGQVMAVLGRSRQGVIDLAESGRLVTVRTATGYLYNPDSVKRFLWGAAVSGAAEPLLKLVDLRISAHDVSDAALAVLGLDVGRTGALEAIVLPNELEDAFEPAVKEAKEVAFEEVESFGADEALETGRLQALHVLEQHTAELQKNAAETAWQEIAEGTVRNLLEEFSEALREDLNEYLADALRDHIHEDVRVVLEETKRERETVIEEAFDDRLREALADIEAELREREEEK